MQQTHQELIDLLKIFSQERQWESYHSPKNLVMALNVESAELMEIFQWLSEKQSQTLTTTQKQAATEEVADVFIYLLQLADQLDIDLIAAAKQKIKLNEAKYPADHVKGSARKYTEYEHG